MKYLTLNTFSLVIVEIFFNKLCYLYCTFSFFHSKGCGLNTKLLHKQQIRLGLLKAARVLFSQQDNLHKVLSQPAVLDLGFASSLETGVGFSSSTEEDLNTLQQEPATNISLLQHLMVAATQPSPLKAIFSREEMEVNNSSFALQFSFVIQS